MLKHSAAAGCTRSQDLLTAGGVQLERGLRAACRGAAVLRASSVVALTSAAGCGRCGCSRRAGVGCFHVLEGKSLSEITRGKFFGPKYTKIK